MSSRIEPRSLAIIPLVLCASCALTTSFDYDVSSNVQSGELFGVQGSIESAGSTKITLSLNGGADIEAVDGPFQFPKLLANGDAFTVTARPPDGLACTVENGSGTIMSGDGQGVRVRCTSSDALLSALTVSVGALSPPFKPLTPDYTVGPLRVNAVLPPTTTTTITATAAAPSATIMINGVATPSGMPSKAITVPGGTTTIEIEVHAPDGRTTNRYAVKIGGRPSDYLKPKTTIAGELFGTAVAIAGTTLVVGAPKDSRRGNVFDGYNQGAIYVFDQVNGAWSESSYLFNRGALSDERLGAAVATDGTAIAVGIPGFRTSPDFFDSDNAGAVTILVRDGSGWKQQALLRAPTPRMDALFGGGLVFSGNDLLVTASDEPLASGPTRAGAIYVFTRTGTTWSSGARLEAPNARVGARFGASAAISGDVLVVGSPGEDSSSTGVNGSQASGNFPTAGAAYIYRRTNGNWGLEAYLKPLVTKRFIRFGSAVGIDEDVVVVGAEGEDSSFKGMGASPTQQADTSAPDAGAVYVFRRANGAWAQEAFLKASNTSAGALLGRRLVLTKDWLFVGAPGEKGAATGVNGNDALLSQTDAGAVFGFQRVNGAWAQKLYVKASTSASMAFGSSLAVFGQRLIVGAPSESGTATGVNGEEKTSGATRSGAVYTF